MYYPEKDSAQYIMLCVCVECIWLREVKWLNYTPETTCNNWYSVQMTLLNSEYSKHPHFNAKSEHKTKSYNWATYDVMTDKMDLIFSQFELLNLVHVKTQNFYSAEIHTQWSKDFQQQT